MRILDLISCMSRLYCLEGNFARNGDFTWRVSDCEELVGVTLEGIMGIIQIKDSSKVPIFIWESMGIFEISESLGTVLLGSDQYH